MLDNVVNVVNIDSINIYNINEYWNYILYKNIHLEF